MATLRTMHKRRKRKLMIAAQPCQHRFVSEYPEGYYCQRCGGWWDMSFWNDEYVEPEWDDWDDEETDWCYGCDEPAWSCTCGDPIDLYDFLTEERG